MIEPYEHENCKKCKWVGWYMHPESNLPANVYLCGQVVIIRNSSEGSDYWSGTAGEMSKHPLEFHDPEHEIKYVEAIGIRQQEFEQERLLDECQRETDPKDQQLSVVGEFVDKIFKATDCCNQSPVIIEEA